LFEFSDSKFLLDVAIYHIVKDYYHPLAVVAPHIMREGFYRPSSIALLLISKSKPLDSMWFLSIYNVNKYLYTGLPVARFPEKVRKPELIIHVAIPLLRVEPAYGTL
jgi:hypothetical protein